MQEVQWKCSFALAAPSACCSKYFFFLQREEYTLAARHPRAVNVSAVSTEKSASRRSPLISSKPVSEEFGAPPVQDHSPGGPSKIAAGASASRSSPTEAEVFTGGLRDRCD